MKRANKPSPESMLPHQTRILVNEALLAAGFDGNRKFPRVGEAISDVQQVLAQFGLEFDEVLNANLFLRSSGQLLVDLARSNVADPFSPTSIRDAALFLTWHRFETGRFEFVAYVS